MGDTKQVNTGTAKLATPSPATTESARKTTLAGRFMSWLRGSDGLDEGRAAVSVDGAADRLAPKPPPSEVPKVRVKPGDTLGGLAARYLGDSSQWTVIYEANRDAIANPNILTPGQILAIPGAQVSTPDLVKDEDLGVATTTGGGGAAATTSVTSAVKGGYKPNAADQAMASGAPLAVGKTELEKEMAAIYNTKGTLVKEEADRLGIEPAVGGAVLSVESDGAGHTEGRLTIRFEPAVFKRYSGKSVSIRRGGQDAEYKALEAAIAIDEDAAYKSISMGAGQIMGFNAGGIGYGSAKEMFDSFQISKKAQLNGVFEFIRVTPVIHRAAKARNWQTFAYHYNGPGYQANAYDTKLQQAYETWQRVTKGLPNA